MVRAAPSINQARWLLGDLLSVVEQAVRDGSDLDALTRLVLEAIDDATDTVTGIVAVHSLARIPGPRAEVELAGRILNGPGAHEQHALWAAGARTPTAGLATLLAGAVARGGLAGMHAQQALARWARRDAQLACSAIESALAEATRPDARRYLVETLGLVPGQAASAALTRLAIDPGESAEVRATSITAFSDRPLEPLPPALRMLAAARDELGRAARATLHLRRLRRRGPRRSHDRGAGIRVAHIHLGEAGGLATLLPQLGGTLAGQWSVAETITLVRDHGGPVAGGQRTEGHRLEAIELGTGEGATFTGRWPSIVPIERAIRAAFLAGALPDVVHLRMADPGSLAGASVARSLGIPIVFTFAPDPHGPMAQAEASGALDRSSFATADARQALWFRTVLVERLAQDAQELVVFPRARLTDRLATLTGIDLTVGRPRHFVVAEGIDTSLSDRAGTMMRDTGEAPPVLTDLHSAISRKPPARHGLPLVVSVGRMHEQKGMARLVEAFAQDPRLAARANLVIVGGPAGEASAQEAAELARIHRLLDEHPQLHEQVVLLGRRSHADVALVLAAAASGWRSAVGPAGSYVCASPKEEFGLAILEAMAAGLPVTAPLDGGPVTYIEDGRTGALVDTSDRAALAAGIHAALDLSKDPALPSRTRALVDERYTLERMARTLAAVYRVTAGATSLGATVAEELGRAA